MTLEELKNLKRGDKVRNCYRERRTVLNIVGNSIMTYEENIWYHYDNLFIEWR